MNNEALIRAWQKWTEPMLPEAHKGTVPIESLYYQAFKAGWEAAVDAQVTRMAYEIESLEQQLRDERKQVRTHTPEDVKKITSQWEGKT